jgi:hypothetical protein
MLQSVSPAGLARGAVTELTVEGLNLAGASVVYFSEPGIKGTILRVKELPDLPDIRLGSNGTPSTVDLGPLPPRNQVTVEVDVPSKAEIGLVRFRLQTPLGTTSEGKFLIEPYYGESADREPNNTADDAVETILPTILTGTISKPGDVDYYKIQVKAGEQLVFENQAALAGSTLQPVVSILAADQAVLHEYGTSGGMDAEQFAHRFEKAGTYYIRVADYQESGRASNFYRIMVGNFPVVARAYPLGVQRGHERDVTLTGWNLPAGSVKVEGKPSGRFEDATLLRAGHSFNEVKFAVGVEPEVDSEKTNRTVAQAQAVTVPVTINGRLDTKDGAPEGYFRFHAKKGEQVIVDVDAERLGSDLDSFVEVLDAGGNRIERATVRAISGTFTALSDRDSVSPNIRISSWADWKPGDYVLIGNEILRVRQLPNGPDEDTRFEQFGNGRLSYFDTSGEAHAADKPVYKVQIYPPGTKFSPNGLPLVHLYYQNDDGGPGWDKDSLVHFTAPADGDYLVHLRDVRGMGGETYTYRLTLRQPRPDFRLALSDPNPNVPAGGCVPENVTAMRMDEFDGAINVTAENLPAGFRATAGVIEPGQVSTSMLLCADANTKPAAAAPLKVIGRAQGLTHEADYGDPLKLIALMPKPDVLMTAETREITLAPGGEAEITVSIQRQNDFHGRVPIDVRNLPPYVLVPDVGLNGILLNENESRRTFKVKALPMAAPGEQTLYVGGVVETRSNLPSVYAAAQTIKLRIVSKSVAQR